MCVDDDDYESFSNISRVVHWEDFEYIYGNQTFENYQMTDDNHSSMIDYDNYEGLFFGPETPKTSHNWYGNVSFKCDNQPSLKMAVKPYLSGLILRYLDN